MAKKKVMIIDDNEEFLVELKEVLMLNNLEVVAINDVASVIERAEQTKPDLILVDLKMPKKSGFHIAEELNKIPHLADIPVIVMSGFFTEIEKANLINVYGVQKCIKKTFDPADLVVKIEEVLAGVI
ncbi:MAG: response regulator [Elusimicrobiota bacterium]